MKAQNRFSDSARNLKSTRVLVSCAMLLALNIVLSLFIRVDLSPEMRVTFGFLAVAMVAHLYGPVPAVLNAALSDIIVYLLRPTGPYHPGFTLSAAMGALIYALAFYQKPVTLARVALSKLIVDILVNLALNTLWIQQLYGRAFLVLLPGRVLKNMAQYAVDVPLMMLVFSMLRKALKLPEPERRGNRGLIACACIVVFALGVWANNTSLFVATQGGHKLLAHRGLQQTFPMDDIKWDTDTSKIIYPPEHPYLENTIDSMREAFALGADVVELDVHRTRDDKLAVFHDHLLEYRTDATGPLSDYTMDELRALDIGYGYTADGGKTWPFRGKGVGLMPELSEVLRAFPDGELLIHVKDGDEITGELIARALRGASEERLAQITVYGEDAPVASFKRQMPALRAMSMSTLKGALIQYELLGWTGYIPEAMRNTQIHLPEVYARYLWGWPAKLVKRMDSVNTRVVLVRGHGSWSEGFDELEQLKAVPDNYTGYIWTNRIDRLAEVERDD